MSSFKGSVYVASGINPNYPSAVLTSFYSRVWKCDQGLEWKNISVSPINKNRENFP